MSPRKQRILIISDSRGRDLEHYIPDYLQSAYSFDFKIYPGITLQSLYNKIKRNRKSYSLQIVIGGICSLTEKSRDRRKKSIKYNTSSEKKREIKDTITKLISLNDHTTVATITPASLSDFFKYNNPSSNSRSTDVPDYSSQQVNLDKDISEINQFIKDTCLDKDRVLVNLAKASYKQSKKRRGKKSIIHTRFYNKSLSDGVHPSSELKKAWSKIISGAIKTFLDFHPSLLDSENSQTEEDDSWNFKRRHSKHH